MGTDHKVDLRGTPRERVTLTDGTGDLRKKNLKEDGGTSGATQVQ